MKVLRFTSRTNVIWNSSGAINLDKTSVIKRSRQQVMQIISDQSSYVHSKNVPIHTTY